MSQSYRHAPRGNVESLLACHFLLALIIRHTCGTSKTRIGRESRLLNRALLRVRSRSRRRIKFFAIIRLLTTCCLRRSFTLYGVGLTTARPFGWDLGRGELLAAFGCFLCVWAQGCGAVTCVLGCGGSVLSVSAHKSCICSSLCATLTCGWSHSLEGAGGHVSQECLAPLLCCPGAGCHSLLGHQSAQVDDASFSCFLAVASFGPLS